MSNDHRFLPARRAARATVAVLLAAAAVVAVTAPATAQQPVAARRPLTQDTYDSWRAIQGPTLSPDGRWVAFTLTPVVGDGEVVVRGTAAGGAEWRAPRGFTGRPQNRPAVDSVFTAPAPEWSADSRHVLFLTYPPRAEFERAARADRRRADQPRTTLSIMSVADGNVQVLPRVRSFRVPRDAGSWVAYLLEPDSAAAAATTARRDSAAPAGAAAATVPGGPARPVTADSVARGRRREYGSTLVVRDLATGTETRIPDVLTYIVADSGAWLGYTVSSRDSTRDGAYVRSMRPSTGSGQAGREFPLLTGRGSYRQLTFDRAATQVAFVSDRDEASAQKPRHALYWASLRGAAPGGRGGSGTPGAARQLVAPGAAAAESLVVADRGRFAFTRDGSAIVFGLAPLAPDSIPADSLADKAIFDLWHYRDTRLQPQQRLEAARDRARAYTAVYQLARGRMTRVGSDTLAQVSVSDDGRVALALASLPYSVEEMWGEGGADAYLVDLATGARTLVAQRLDFGAALSPGGKYVVYFHDGHWFAHPTASPAQRVNLTQGITGVRFEQETWDVPSAPAPWGIAGWTPGDASLVLNARYDLWEVDPSGRRAARAVTDSVGVRQRITFRLVDFSRDDPYVDPSAVQILRALDQETKASGFWRDRVQGGGAPERIVMGDERYGTPARARNGSTYVVTRESFTRFPDLWAGQRLDSLTRLTDANPQQREYRWGSAELVEWLSDDAVPLKGLLFKPGDFDASRKYPMIVYFYEQYSDDLHQYRPPSGRNTINPTVWTSLGYVVFIPDIAYTTGYPGPSALKSIVPGVQALIARGFVNPQAIGISGQSWGGYQTAYIITQSNLFRAAFAGAPVANMTSAYGGIRWESGIARPFQYEHTQSRIGGSLWQYPTRYIENSPLFYADRIRTPLFIMHNDNDGAVPWQEGIQLYVALRRLGREVYLITYNGDGHNPRKRANQKDMDMRKQQFFAHHLLGAPAPDWMKRGVPFLRKGSDQVAATSAAPLSNEKP